MMLLPCQSRFPFVQAISHVQVSLQPNSDSWRPRRICNDTDPARTLINPWPYPGFTGCEYFTLSSKNTVNFVEFQGILLLTGVSSKVALGQSLVCGIMLGAGALLAGVNFLTTVGYCLVFFLLFGVGVSCVCEYECQEARQHFSLCRVANMVTRKSTALLHTLIPENVLLRMAQQPDGEFLVAKIPQGTIMFLSLSLCGGHDAAAADRDFGLKDPAAQTIDSNGNRCASVLTGGAWGMPDVFFTSLRHGLASAGCVARRTIDSSGNFVPCLTCDTAPFPAEVGSRCSPEPRPGDTHTHTHTHSHSHSHSHTHTGLAKTQGARCQAMDIAEFERVSRVVAALDDVVHAYGMTKYQHVAQWYIVVCPAVAEPFDQEER